jgi:hypothetical protein
MMKFRVVGATALVGLFSLAAVTLGANEMTLTGKVGDAMCGVKHMMADEVACTEACVKKGADYALIVNDKAYTLKTTDAKVKADLGKLAGKLAEIKGDVNGNTIMVASVKMGMMPKK